MANIFQQQRDYFTSKRMHDPAFTLVELMVAVAVGLSLTAAMAMGFSQFVSVFERVKGLAVAQSQIAMMNLILTSSVDEAGFGIPKQWFGNEAQRMGALGTGDTCAPAPGYKVIQQEKDPATSENYAVSAPTRPVPLFRSKLPNRIRGLIP